MSDLQIANMAKALRHLTEPLQEIGYQENTLHWKAADALERQAARIKELESERSELIESIRQMLDEAYEQGKYESEAATIERLAQRAFLAGCGKPGCTDCIGGALAAEFRTLAKPIQPLPLASEERKD